MEFTKRTEIPPSRNMGQTDIELSPASQCEDLVTKAFDAGYRHVRTLPRTKACGTSLTQHRSIRLQHIEMKVLAPLLFINPAFHVKISSLLVKFHLVP